MQIKSKRIIDIVKQGEIIQQERGPREKQEGKGTERKGKGEKDKKECNRNKTVKRERKRDQ